MASSGNNRRRHSRKVRKAPRLALRKLPDRFSQGSPRQAWKPRRTRNTRQRSVTGYENGFSAGLAAVAILPGRSGGPHEPVARCLAPRPDPPQGLGAGRADDSVERFRSPGAPGGQHGGRPPAARLPARRGSRGRQPVHPDGRRARLPAHGHHRLRRPGRRPRRWRRAAPDPRPGPGHGAAPGPAARRAGPAPERLGPATDATFGGTDRRGPRLLPYPPARPAGGPGQLRTGRLVPRHAERTGAIGDPVDHQPEQHRPGALVRPRPRLGRARRGPRLGAGGMERRPARPGPDLPRPGPRAPGGRSGNACATGCPGCRC